MEQRLIDANKLTREEILHLWYHLPNGDIACPKIDIDHAPTILTIPDNPTNGDVIKAIFPDAKITEYLDLVQVEIIVKGLNLVEIECDINWWNAPYRMENEIEDGNDSK